jgi:hypothetical protein
MPWALRRSVALMDRALAVANGSSVVDESAGEADGVDDSQASTEPDELPLVARAVLTLVCAALRASGAEGSFAQLARCHSNRTKTHVDF